MLAVEPEDLAAAGAFALGVMVGGYAMIQAFKLAVDRLRGEHDDDVDVDE